MSSPNGSFGVVSITKQDLGGANAAAFLVVILGASGVHATTVTSVSCTLNMMTKTSTGAEPATCSIHLAQPGNPEVSAYALAGDAISGTGGSVMAMTHAEGGSVGSVAPFQFAATASASDSLTLLSAGAARSGFIRFDIFLDYFHQEDRIPTVASALR